MVYWIANPDPNSLDTDDDANDVSDDDTSNDDDDDDGGDDDDDNNDDNALLVAVTLVISTRLGSTPTVAATAVTKAFVVSGLINSYYY